MADTNYSLNAGTGIPTKDSVALTKVSNTPTDNDKWKAKAFNPSKYNIEQMHYPVDLQDGSYDGNMVVFYINVLDASKFKPNSRGGYYNADELDTPRLRMMMEGIPATAEGLAVASTVGSAIKGAGYGALAGASQGAIDYNDKKIGGLWNFTKSTFKASAYGAAAGLGSAATSAIGLGAAASIAGSTSRETKRLRSAIALHMPNNLNIRYSTNWDTTDTAGIAMAGAMGDNLGAIKALKDTDLRGTSEDSGKTGNTIGSIIASMGLSQNSAAAGATSAYTGLAANPRKEMVFKGVDFRTFQFDYKFFPKSEAESILVENIINAFKFHMQPEYKDANSFLYLYPSEFDIAYYSGENENLHIHRHTSCVLTDMQINYTPNGNFTVFANGMPTQIDITLTFKELALMSKEMIVKGL